MHTELVYLVNVEVYILSFRPEKKSKINSVDISCVVEYKHSLVPEEYHEL